MTAPRLARSLAPLGLLLVAALVLSACGSSSGGSSGTAASSSPTPGARRGFGSFLTAAQRSCLQKQGLGFPQRGRRPPGGGEGHGQGGGRFRGEQQRPSLTDAQRKALAARQQKTQAAFKACGVQFPQRRPGTTN